MRIRSFIEFLMLFILIVPIALLTACYNEEDMSINILDGNTYVRNAFDQSFYPKFELTKLAIPNDKRIGGAIALFDDSVILADFNDTNRINFYRYYFDGGKLIKFGGFDNFLMGMRQFEIVDDKIYFHITVADDDFVSNMQNILFEIDLTRNELSQLSHDSDTLPGVNTYWFDGKLVSLKSRSENNVTTSFLEVTDLDAGTSEIVLESYADEITNTGVLKVLHTTDGSLLYVLYDSRPSEDDEWTAVIKAYNKDFEHVRDIQINDVAWDIFRSRPSILRVFGEYIFLLNYSSRSFIGRIEENGEVLPIHRGTLSMSQTRDLNLSSHVELLYENPYYTNNNNIVLLDTESGMLHEITIDMEDGYVWQFIMKNENMAIITARPPDAHENEFFIVHIDPI